MREYGGDPRAIAALIRAVFHRLDDPDTSTSERPPGQRATIELTVTTPALRTGLPALLAQVGIPHSLGYMGMIAILDAPGLFEALRLRDVELTPSDRGWLARHDGTHPGADTTAAGQARLRSRAIPRLCARPIPH